MVVTHHGTTAAERRQAAGAHHVLPRCRQIVVQQDGIKAIVNAMAAHTDSMALSGSQFHSKAVLDRDFLLSSGKCMVVAAFMRYVASGQELRIRTCDPFCTMNSPGKHRPLVFHASQGLC